MDPGDSDRRVRDALAKVLIDFRLKRGLSQGDVAESIGASYAVIGQVERGVSPLSLKTMRALADAHPDLWTALVPIRIAQALVEMGVPEGDRIAELAEHIASHEERVMEVFQRLISGPKITGAHQLWPALTQILSEMRGPEHDWPDVDDDDIVGQMVLGMVRGAAGALEVRVGRAMALGMGNERAPDRAAEGGGKYRTEGEE